jgi:hypothetical protein
MEVWLLPQFEKARQALLQSLHNVEETIPKVLNSKVGAVTGGDTTSRRLGRPVSTKLASLR